MRRPTVSVLMNCLNGARYLREALDSVFAQTYQDWEVVFWDDASTDESVTIAKSYGRKVRIFHGLGGMPLGYSRNCALARVRGEQVAILDCDDRWHPHHLERYRTLPSPYWTLLTQANPLYSSTLVFWTPDLIAHGGWNPTLRYAETYDLCLRLAHDGKSIMQSHAPTFIRRHAAQACGRGHAAVTKEVLITMRPHRWRAGPRQVLREGLLWAKYGLQRVREAL